MAPKICVRYWKELGNNQKAELNSVQPSPASCNDSDRLCSLLDKYQDVFNENQIGKMEEITAKIYMKDDAKPKFVKARPVPYSLQNKVNDELARLESEGIITRVSHSEWVSPIVPVVKSDNTVRICGDFKTTVNPQINVEQYPTQRIEDMFATLSGNGFR